MGAEWAEDKVNRMWVGGEGGKAITGPPASKGLDEEMLLGGLGVTGSLSFLSFLLVLRTVSWSVF